MISAAEEGASHWVMQ